MVTNYQDSNKIDIETKPRIAYIDHLRGIAILLVVVGHFIQYNTIESKDNVLFSIIYSFHMPLFMFISGYIALRTTKIQIFDNYANFLLKKGRALLIPFFVWPLIVDNFFFTNQLQFDFAAQVTGLFEDPRIGLWFLWYLFFLTILFSAFLFLSSRINKEKKIYADIFIAGILLTGLIILRMVNFVVYMDSFIQYFGYFFIGVFLAKYAWIREKVLDVRYFTLFVLTFMIVVGHFSFNDSNFHNLGLSLLIKVIAAIVGTLSLYFIVNNIVFPTVVDKYITNWGTTSLVIYATHFKFIYVFQGLFMLPKMSMFLLILISLFFAVAIIQFCMYIYKIIKLSPFLDLLLYGNRAKSIVKKGY